MTYTPKPIDASHIELPSELLRLTELLAENAHDVWAVKRIAEGWTYGPTRDNEQKTNPLLIPYADLPESEKQLDREAALSALRAIIALGYRMEKSHEESSTGG